MAGPQRPKLKLAIGFRDTTGRTVAKVASLRLPG
jgi:hypothetical protein